MRHPHAVPRQQSEVVVVEPHRVGGDDAAVERADVFQQGGCAHPVTVEHDGTLGLRLREVDLEERALRRFASTAISRSPSGGTV